MHKSKYFNDLLRLLSLDEIIKSLENPTKYMTKTHLILHKIAIRKLTRG